MAIKRYHCHYIVIISFISYLAMFINYFILLFYYLHHLRIIVFLCLFVYLFSYNCQNTYRYLVGMGNQILGFIRRTKEQDEYWRTPLWQNIQDRRFRYYDRMPGLRCWSCRTIHQGSWIPKLLRGEMR